MLPLRRLSSGLDVDLIIPAPTKLVKGANQIPVKQLLTTIASELLYVAVG